MPGKTLRASVPGQMVTSSPNRATTVRIAFSNCSRRLACKSSESALLLAQRREQMVPGSLCGKGKPQTSQRWYSLINFCIAFTTIHTLKTTVTKVSTTTPSSFIHFTPLRNVYWEREGKGLPTKRNPFKVLKQHVQDAKPEGNFP